MDLSKRLLLPLRDLIFFLIGAFFYARANNLKRFLQEEHRKERLNKFLVRYLYLEIAFVFVSLLFVAILNAAAASRVFIERSPIFG